MDHADLIYRCIQADSLVDYPRFRSLYQFLLQAGNSDGDIAELGVYKGGTAAGMAMIAPNKILHLFDTFEGLREPQFEEPHRKGDFSDTSEASVQALFNPRGQVQVHKGWFPETVTEDLARRRFSFVHVDAAYYESTRDAIEFFFPRLSPGGVILFDDWEWFACPGVKRALLEGQDVLGFEITIPTPNQAYIKRPEAGR